MKAIFNDQYIDAERLLVNAEDRAFQYGDGIFETIVLQDKHWRLLEYHHKRITDGAKALALDIPEYLTIPYLKEHLARLMKENHFSKPVRIKIQIWRSGEGFYRPLSNLSNILITIRKHRESLKPLSKVCVSEKVKNQFSVYSAYKTISALPYVLAGIEMNLKECEDLIILDLQGNVSELLYSNIFWIKNGAFFTPSLGTGCIRGVMRSFIIDHLKKKRIEVHEVNESLKGLFTADHVFSSNASGIRPVLAIENHHFKHYPDWEKITG